MHQLKLQSRPIKLPHGWQGVIECFAKKPYAIIFDSAAQGELGRLSHASFSPINLLSLDSKSGKPSVISQFKSMHRAFFEMFEVVGKPATDVFYSGWAGLLGYDLRCEIEELPDPKPEGPNFPDLQVGFYGWTLTHDHSSDETTLHMLKGLENTPDSISELRMYLRNLLKEETETKPSKLVEPDLLTGKEQYLVSARKVLDHIFEGDIYQANLTREVVYEGVADPLKLYQSLRKHNPAPFGGFLDCGEGRYVLSSSPERFIRIKDGQIETRPIKGTRARSVDPVEDARIIEELANSEKDRAELTMIVDLERNDLGRICKPGTVKVTELMQVHSYETVHHLEATITGELRNDVSVEDYIRATFPGGSITGAPKKRAMEIIHELEPVRRGPYTGSMFYLTPDGHFESNILIRTLNVEPNRVSYHVGGGIVADSVPEAEWQETLDKGAALEAALKEFTGA